jgi:hypothetical protein
MTQEPAIVLTVVPERIRATQWRRGSFRALVGDWTHALSVNVHRSYVAAFPPERCTVGAWLVVQQCDLSRPSPPTPAGVAALIDGALLYEIDSEPVSDSFIA